MHICNKNNSITACENSRFYSHCIALSLHVGGDMWVLTSRFPYLLLPLSAPFHSGSLLFVPFPLQNITKCCEIFLDFSLFPPPLDSRFPPLSIVVLSSLSHFYCKILRNVTKYYKILRNVVIIFAKKVKLLFTRLKSYKILKRNRTFSTCCHHQG